jgi:hypothetical protein
VRLVRLGTTGTTRVDFLDLNEVPLAGVTETGEPRWAFEPPQPNPAHRAVEIGFSLPATAGVTLAAYDVSGRLVATLLSGLTPAGSHRLQWELRDDRGQRVQAGVYFLRLAAPGRELVRRIAIVP